MKDGTRNLYLPVFHSLEFLHFRGSRSVISVPCNSGCPVTVEVLRHWRSCTRGGPCDCWGDVKVELMKQQWSWDSGGAGTVEVMGQWRLWDSGGPATVAIKALVKKKWCRQQLKTMAEIKMMDNNNKNNISHLQIIESETRLYHAMKLVEDQQL